MSDDIEEWRSIAGYAGLYEVSDHGRVRSVDRRVEYFDPRSSIQTSRLAPGRPLRPGKERDGHLYVGLWKDGAGRYFYVARLVALAFVGPEIANTEVAHWDGDRLNNRPGNLRWATRKENAADRERHGTRIYGEGSVVAKLSEADVVQIKYRIMNGESDISISRDFAVTDSAIYAIRKGRSWRHVLVRGIAA